MAPRLVTVRFRRRPSRPLRRDSADPFATGPHPSRLAIAAGRVLLFQNETSPPHAPRIAEPQSRSGVRVGRFTKNPVDPATALAGIRKTRGQPADGAVTLILCTIGVISKFVKKILFRG
jgi:hypothetical protein